MSPSQDLTRNVPVQPVDPRPIASVLHLIIVRFCTTLRPCDGLTKLLKASLDRASRVVYVCQLLGVPLQNWFHGVCQTLHGVYQMLHVVCQTLHDTTKTFPTEDTSTENGGCNNQQQLVWCHISFCVDLTASTL